MLDDRVLSDFMGRFLGYGSLESKVWFIGMEEGGGNSLNEIQARLRAWQELGSQDVVDVAVFHEKFGQAKWFRQNAPTQPTWRSLIRLALHLQKRPCELEDVRRHQVNEFGRAHGGSAILELMPLPSPSASHWQYSQWSDLNELNSREAYLNAILPERIRRLKEVLDRYRPNLVFFYGLGYRRYWEEVMGLSDSPKKSDPFTHRDGQSTFVILPHPASRQLTNSPWMNFDWADKL